MTKQTTGQDEHSGTAGADQPDAVSVEAPPDIAVLVQAYNEIVDIAHRMLPFEDPIGRVRWVHVDDIVANDYNPNAVAYHEMRLLHTSITEDGYTQPIVTMYDSERERYEIVDGFHRYTVLRRHRDVQEATFGYLPVVVIDKPITDRIASTVRHNRARGKHSVTGMADLVFRMLREGATDVEVCNKVGLEPEELARLKHVTGYSKLHADHEYSRPTLTDRQIRYKAKYKREHPDEPIPKDF